MRSLIVGEGELRGVGNRLIQIHLEKRPLKTNCVCSGFGGGGLPCGRCRVPDRITDATSRCSVPVVPRADVVLRHDARRTHPQLLQHRPGHCGLRAAARRSAVAHLDNFAAVYRRHHRIRQAGLSGRHPSHTCRQLDHTGPTTVL